MMHVTNNITIHGIQFPYIGCCMSGKPRAAFSLSRTTFVKNLRIELENVIKPVHSGTFLWGFFSVRTMHH